jgi:hypothetical protein
MVTALRTVYGGRLVFDAPSRPLEQVPHGGRYVLTSDGRAINTIDVPGLLAGRWGGVSGVFRLHLCRTVEGHHARAGR